MRIMLLLAMITLSSAQAMTKDEDAAMRAKEFASEVRDYESLAIKTDAAIDYILRRACLKLGENDICREWRYVHKGALQRSLYTRDIEAVAGLIRFVDASYATIQKKMGYPICHALRLDDLLTLNKINAVFQPCALGLTNYTCVMAGDLHSDPSNPHAHRGFLPVLSFWTTEISLTFGTVGILTWFSGPIAMLVEWGVDREAPHMARGLYAGACQ